MQSSASYADSLYRSHFKLVINFLGRPFQEFSFGGEADSTYEYFIKEYLLLGGTKDQYKDLYVRSIEAAENHLFFRPLVEGDPDILFSGRYRTRYKEDNTATSGELVGHMEHLVL